MNTLAKIFLHFFFLGLHSFGGPVAHLGYFHRHFVIKNKWISESDYQELVALCQFLPGPASSQVGMAIGHQHGGILGAIAAWLGFTLPSATLLILFCLGIQSIDPLLAKPYILAAKIFTIAIVGHALKSMMMKFCRSLIDWSLCIATASILLIMPHSLVQVGLIVLAGIFGAVFGEKFYQLPQDLHEHRRAEKKERMIGLSLLLLFTILLVLTFILIPLLSASASYSSLLHYLKFFHTGSLVFGGGHVVLPLLSESFVGSGQLTSDQFLSGYAAAQLVPGPLFTIAAYLGTGLQGIAGGVLATFAIFLPSFLLIIGILPFWNDLKKYRRMAFALKAINPAVVGLLLAAFIDPVVSSVLKSIIAYFP